MNRIAMSAAASGVLRALIARAAVPRDRILLTQVQSTDWQSLTFVGERHEFDLRITAPDAAAAIGRLCSGLEDAEFTIAGHTVADIAMVGEPRSSQEGSFSVRIEALTIAE